MRSYPCLLLWFFTLAATAAGGRAATIVHAGRLIDGVSDSATERATLVIENGRITAVEDGFREPGSGDTVIDLRDSTVNRFGSGSWRFPRQGRPRSGVSCWCSRR